MPNRRRSGRKATASTSKKETPEKSRRSSRRRGHKKSDSEPEADDSVSDRSFEEQEKNQIDVDPLALTKNEGTANDASKGEESGGSDGAWQVRSENGNKGGIPKLKLCLQRPADMSSPTSDTLPSPRARRSRRGATDSPSKPENNEEQAIEEASTSADGDMERRSTRLRRHVEKKEDDEERQDDDPEEAKRAAEEAAEKQRVLEETRKREEKEAQEAKEAAAKALEEKKQQELEKRRVEELERESRRKKEVAAAAEKAAAEESKRIAEEKRVADEKQAALETQKKAELAAAAEKKVNEEVVNDSGRKQRSPSRDSSEERAKEAALRSRKAKLPEDSETHTPTFPARNGGRIRTTGLDESSSAKENHQEGSAVVRKRRWGSSSSSSVKPVAISTDILKEIIPEAKIVPLSEVKLSPNRDEVMEVAVEEEVKKTPVPNRRHSLPSDESEKDYEEEGVESGGEEMVKKRTPVATNHIDEPPKRTVQNDVRKVVIAETSLDDLKQRSPSPAKHKPSNILYITNLVRPFTVVQLRDLLARTGSIVPENGFWIDSIKSRCYVKYTNEEDAKATRHALHRIQWPASNPKQLTVDFGTEEDMSSAIEGNRARSPKRVVTEERKDRERDRERHRADDDRKRSSDGQSRVVDNDRAEKPSRTVRKITVPVREWDVGKTERGISPPIHDAKHYDDDRRKRERDRHRRSSSTEPTRKIKRKDEPERKVSLDELFRKTKATPCIYWLPLTPHQQALKEEMRRKHMEEHEKQLAEHRKRREAKGVQKQRSRSRSPKK